MFSRRTFLSTGIAGLSAGAVVSYRGDFSDGKPPMEIPAGPDDVAWELIRSQFKTDPGVAYLNNASLGMPPTVVAEAVAHGYELHSRNPSCAKHELSGIVANQSIPSLARFLGADPDEIVLTRNATQALHLAAVGLKLVANDEVLITTQEHPAGRRPWHFRKTRNGLDVKQVFIPSPFNAGDQVVDLMVSQITDRTRAIAFCHVTRGGHLYPVKQLCAIARKHGIATVVDGAQAIGMIPIDLHDLGCDVYAASLHKWLLGPIGTGLLFVLSSARKRWRSMYEGTATLDQPAYEPPGTPALPLRAAIDTAVGLIQRIGIEAIAERDRYLSDYLKARLSEIPAAKIVSGPTPDTSAPGSTIFVLKDVDPVVAVSVLERDGLYIDEHVRDGHDALRISTHFYNMTSEIDRVVEALRALAA